MNLVDSTVSNPSLREHVLKTSDTNIVEKMMAEILKPQNYVWAGQALNTIAKDEIEYALKTFPSSIKSRNNKKDTLFRAYLNENEKEPFTSYDARQRHGYNFEYYMKYYILYLTDENELPTQYLQNIANGFVLYLQQQLSTRDYITLEYTKIGQGLSADNENIKYLNTTPKLIYTPNSPQKIFVNMNDLKDRKPMLVYNSQHILYGSNNQSIEK